MKDENLKKDFLEWSKELKKDFQKMPKHKKMTIEEYADFISSVSEVFPEVNKPRKHIHYKNAKI